MARCAQFMALAQRDPDDCCKTLCILYWFYAVFYLLSSFFPVASRRYISYGTNPDDWGQILHSIYWFYTIFDLLWSFFSLESRGNSIRTICDRVVAVQSCDHINRAQLKQRDYGEPRWEIVLRPQYELCERRQTFWTFQNSALRLERLVRPYGDLCDLPRPHWDRSATAVRPYCDLTRFGLKIGRSTVAVRSQPWCDWGIKI